MVAEKDDFGTSVLGSGWQGGWPAPDNVADRHGGNVGVAVQARSGELVTLADVEQDEIIAAREVLSNLCGGKLWDVKWVGHRRLLRDHHTEAGGCMRLVAILLAQCPLNLPFGFLLAQVGTLIIQLLAAGKGDLYFSPAT
jgi:hypothetical protein